jgi:hypothetical protein
MLQLVHAELQCFAVHLRGIGSRGQNSKLVLAVGWAGIIMLLAPTTRSDVTTTDGLGSK